MPTFYPAGGKTYNLNSSISSTATTIILSSFAEPVSGVLYTMALLNTSIAFGTIQPKTTSSEFISFTGITQNADGTATLTGVTRGLAKKYPFTTSAVFQLPHSGQSPFILSDMPQVFLKYASVDNDITINGLWTFVQTPIGLNPGAVQDSSTTVKGIGKLSTAPVSATNPIFVGDNDTRVPTQGENDALVGDDSSIAVGTGNKFVTQTGSQIGAETYAVTTGAANTYEVALTPVPVALVAGMALRLKANFGNTGASFLALTGVNGATIGTATMTIASPCVISFTSHGLVAGDIVKFTTTGALPTGLTVGTKYYVISAGLTANAFEVSTTLGGSAVNTTGSQSGTHTLIRQTANLTKLGTTALASGDWANGMEATWIFDGTQWQMQSPTATITASFISALTTLTVATTTNTDTVFTSGFAPRTITIYYLLQGVNASASLSYSLGVAVYNSAGTLIANQGNFANLTSAITLTPAATTHDTTAPFSGVGSGSGIIGTLTINAVSATGFTVRLATTQAAAANFVAKFTCVVNQ